MGQDFLDIFDFRAVGFVQPNTVLPCRGKRNKLQYEVKYIYSKLLWKLSTVCPRSLDQYYIVYTDQFYLASLLYKMGHYFLDILYSNFL